MEWTLKLLKFFRHSSTKPTQGKTPFWKFSKSSRTWVFPEFGKVSSKKHYKKRQKCCMEKSQKLGIEHASKMLHGEVAKTGHPTRIKNAAWRSRKNEHPTGIKNAEWRGRKIWASNTHQKCCMAKSQKLGIQHASKIMHGEVEIEQMLIHQFIQIHNIQTALKK